jgi:LacI family transcriptional regulator
MSTIKEIAKRAEVSIGTVSNVINGSAVVSPGRHERVLAAIRELDYHPNHVARSLKMKQTRMLGMVISDITNPFFPQLVRGAEDAALEHNYLLITFNTDDRIEREKQVLAVLRARRVDGILLVVAPNGGNDGHIKNVLESGMPTVCLDRVLAEVNVDSVSVDNEGGSRICVQHLLAMGHRKIAIITGPTTLQTARERLQGYKEAIEGAKIDVKPELIREGDFRSESGYKLGRELLASSNRPSAVFVSNNMMALGVLRAVEELGLHCPEDVAIAMFDDFPLADVLHPRLTAVAQPAYSIGYRGAELLIERIEKKSVGHRPVRIRLTTELKIRQSTAGFWFGPGLRHEP